MLEKTQEIKPVNPKGNQPWIFTGRTDAEAEAPILWPPDVKSWLIGKHPDAGKDWGQEKGMTEDEMVGRHHWLNGHEFEQTPGASLSQWTWVWANSRRWWRTENPGVLQIYGVTESWTRLNNWTTMTIKISALSTDTQPYSHPYLPQQHQGALGGLPSS